MFSLPVKKVMEKSKLLTAAPDITVSAAAKLMAERKVGAVLVVDGKGGLTGIFTERDALLRVIAQGRDVQTTRLSDVMTPAPQTISPEKSFGLALHMMYEKGYRHVPVVENGKPVGIVSARNALDPDLEEYEVESQRRKQILREDY